jgi:micrococcal nuclease
LYEYRARVVRWIDGDTVVCDIDLGLFTWVHDQHLRLYGIDAPDVQPAKGEATAFVRGLAPYGAQVTIRTYKDASDKYGRWLAEVFTGDPTVGPSVNQQLVDTGHAVAYFGGTR